MVKKSDIIPMSEMFELCFYATCRLQSSPIEKNKQGIPYDCFVPASRLPSANETGDECRKSRGGIRQR